jgi:outer membrane protein OmpA-like peptidoglycan-associated protein
MARVKIQPGGKLLVAVIVLGALLFLFFELKPSDSRKSDIQPVVPSPTVTIPAKTPEPNEGNEQVSKNVPEKAIAQAPQRYTMNEAPEGSPIRIYFDFNRAGINKNVYCIFDRIEELAQHNGAGGLRIVVEGNADSIGPSWYNVELSRKRASRVADSLSKRLGIPLKNISIVANGSTRPISSNSTRGGRADNRRTDVILRY